MSEFYVTNVEAQYYCNKDATFTVVHPDGRRLEFGVSDGDLVIYGQGEGGMPCFTCPVQSVTDADESGKARYEEIAAMDDDEADEDFDRTYEEVGAGDDFIIEVDNLDQDELAAIWAAAMECEPKTHTR